MKAADVRRAFLEFWQSKGHTVVASSSLVPANDPTLLFTNAGMVQFKDVFTGVEQRPFFQMNGNFSFGDYFKEDAIAGAWELLTKVYKIDPSRMCVTIFGGNDPKLPGIGADEEARAIWKRVTGFADDRVIGLGAKDNFWMMGETGPMGPCTEIHYLMDGAPTAWPTQDPASWKGWLEIWNLVFMQYERRTAGGELFSLPAPSIDTGAGLERVTSVIQGVKSNYDTDLFTGILQEAARLAGEWYGKNPDVDTSLRVIADHARCATFLIADGVFPDKGEREYVLRRIFRRAVRHGKMLGIQHPFMHEVCSKVIAEMKGAYPELAERETTIRSVALEEEKRFRDTLDRGLKLLDDEFATLTKTGAKQVSGKAIFTLHDTYGFPDDLTEIIATERGFSVDKAGFDEEMAKAQERSKFSGSGQEAIAGDVKAIALELGATKFLGYEGRGTTGEGEIKAILVDGKRARSAAAGTRVQLVFDQTPFYGESGGQIGDTGEITTSSTKIRIDDTKKPTGDVIVLIGEVMVPGTLVIGDHATFKVDDERRERIRANHSATHLLHHALKQVLGSHVAQKGSLVSPDRLRFDFAHFAPMTEEEKRKVEDLVNTEIRRNKDSVVEVLPIEQAKQKGAVAMFGEKYGDQVRVVSIGGESIEFCGGTHVRRAGDIGLMKIIGEAGVAQGVRRIEAVTGAGALDYLRKLEDELVKVGERLKTAPFEVAQRVDKLLADQKTTDREIEKLKQRLASGGGARDLMSETVTIKGIRVLAAAIEVDDAKVLRDTGDQLRDKLGSGVVVLAGTGGAEIRLVAMVTKDLVDKISAGKLLGEVAALLGGRAGGRPEMAQGGGKDVAALPAALAAARTWVETHT